MTFEEWWAEKVEAGYGEVEKLIREAWDAATKAEREACAKVCEEIAMKHQQNEGTYAAGKKAVAFECAEALRSN